MTARSERHILLRSLEVEIDDQLTLVEESEVEIEEVAAGGWAFDPNDVVREEVGLRNLLDAVHTLDTDRTKAELQ